MVGDSFRRATIQPAWRAGEESDNRFQSATIQPAWRVGERLDNRIKPICDANPNGPATPDDRAGPRAEPPMWSGEDAGRTFQRGSTPSLKHGLVVARWWI
jgi:hypothetical protein